MGKNLRFKWILLVGGLSFLIGFVGPMVLAPDANQGPMLGIFVTGPLGVILGGIGWLLSENLDWSYSRQTRVAISFCAVIFIGVIASVLWPQAEWPGRLYELKVVGCERAVNAGEVVLTTTVLHERQVKKEKPIFKPQYYWAGEIMTKNIRNESFYISGDCASYPVGFEGKYFVSNHPAGLRDKAVLEVIPDFAKGL